MAATSPLSSENGGKDHEYQILERPGPKGAYESRQVNGGLYVRVDMPGVPPDGIKLTKRAESLTVTFTGKAPRLWPDCEKSDRVYGGYVVLDRNPCEIDIEMSLVNGSLKLFFPASDGLLHFFPPKKTISQRSAGSHVKHFGDEKQCCHNKLREYMETLESLDERYFPRGFEGFRNMSLHPSGCQCCKTGEKNEEIDNAFTGRKSSIHINPFLLDGVEGVLENYAVVNASSERLYFRVDMPGIEEKDVNIEVEEAVRLIYVGHGLVKEHPLDEGGRTYAGGVLLDCTCCKIIDVKHTMKHGVLRFSFRRRTIPSCVGKDCKYCLESYERGFRFVD